MSIADALITAAEQLLTERGLEGFSTNRIAKRAGVSVGSLYQYFPNKDSLLAEVARRLERRTAASLIAVLEECRACSLEVAAGRIVDLLLSEDIGAMKMRRVVRREVPSSWTDETSSLVDGRVRDELANELTRRDDVRGGPTPVIVWVVAHAVETLVEHAVLTMPELLASEAFRDELVQLIVRYLRAEDSPAARNG